MNTNINPVEREQNPEAINRVAEVVANPPLFKSIHGAYMRLDPLRIEDASELFRVSQHREIWRFLPVPMPETLSEMQRIIEKALIAGATGCEFPFVIRNAVNGEVVGSTRYLDIQRENHSLEIGWTWLSPAVQRSAINSEAKYQLLKYAFENLQCSRVQLKTDGRNVQSQAAIERLGAVQEGILRKHRKTYDGFMRDTVMYSILSDEWPVVKQSLQKRMGSYLRQSLKAEVEKIWIFPIKSLDGVNVTQSAIGAGGGLHWDRSWRIADAVTEEVLTAKAAPVLQSISADFEILPTKVVVSLRSRINDESYGSIRAHLPGEEWIVAEWLTRKLGRSVTLEFSEIGFPDDTDARGPTIISSETISLIAQHFSLSAQEVARRFRANIQISGEQLPAFWEDSLFGPQGTLIQFRIGAVHFEGSNPCQRCAVPARDSRTGKADRGFQVRLADLRRQLLPAWTCDDRFNHYYRVAVNTNIAPSELRKEISVGDPLNCEIKPYYQSLDSPR